MAVVENPRIVEFGVRESSHFFLAGGTVAVDVGAPDVGDHIAKDVVVDLLVVAASVGHQLCCVNAVFHNEQSQRHFVGNILQKLDVGSY